MAEYEGLTDEQWAVLVGLIPEPQHRATGAGRNIRVTREVLDGVLWVLRNAARWQDLPARFPPHQTCYGRFQKWLRDGTMRHVLEALAKDLEERGDIDVSKFFTDPTFVLSKTAPCECGSRKGAKAQSCWRCQTARLFLSPYTRRLLCHLESPLGERLSLKYLPISNLNE